MKRLIKTWFSLDLRSLAFLRIGIGTAILLDLIQRACDLIAFYTDKGVLPRSELFRLWDMRWLVSIHTANGDIWFQVVLFVIAGIFSLFLITGYRTKLSVILSWFLLISLQTRNPMVLQGGDIVLRTTLFFMMFLPLAQRWSLDRLLNRIPSSKKGSYFDISSVGYVVQICLLYVFTGILKTGAPWHEEASAIYYALSIDQLITPLGATLLSMDRILPFLTRAVLYFETFGVLLFFIPWKNWIFRTVGVFGFILMQIGFNASMRLGFFGVIAITSLLGLLPSEFWDKLIYPIRNAWAKKARTGLRIVYDTDCSFCHKTTLVLKRLLLLSPSTEIIASKDDQVARQIMDQEDSWVVYDTHGKIYTGWAGVCTVIAYSPWAFIFIPFIKNKIAFFFGEPLYRLIAKNRMNACIPEPLPKKKRFRVARNGILAFLVIYIVIWNIATLPNYSLKREWESIGFITRLDQKFDMFSPRPLTEDGWYVFPAQLRNGVEIDMFSGRSPISYDKPENIAYMYKNQRWQKYLMNLWLADFSEFRLGYGRYLCREWNKSHTTDNEVLNFQMVFMLEETPPPGETPIEIQKKVIWEHFCF